MASLGTNWAEIIIAVATSAGAIGSVLAALYIRKTWRSEEATQEQEKKHFLLEKELDVTHF
jgi:hypothetical protein